MKLTYTFNEYEIDTILACEGELQEHGGPQVTDGSHLPPMLLGIIKAVLPEKCKRRGINWKILFSKTKKKSLPPFAFDADEFRKGDIPCDGS